jgi:hypothetical protein
MPGKDLYRNSLNRNYLRPLAFVQIYEAGQLKRRTGTVEGIQNAISKIHASSVGPGGTARGSFAGSGFFWRKYWA